MMTTAAVAGHCKYRAWSGHCTPAGVVMNLDYRSPPDSAHSRTFVAVDRGTGAVPTGAVAEQTPTRRGAQKP